MSATVTMTDHMHDPLLEEWTDDQEAALLRAIMHWKPVGMHKHFRMVSIKDYMLNSGVTTVHDEHTSAAGIWKKLNTLYDMEGLDEREDSVTVMNDVRDDEGETAVEYWREFELPRIDFEEMMWDRRLAPEGTSSPEMSRRESTVADTDEPRSSPVSNRGSGRGGRGSARKSGRLTRLQNELDTERSSRRTSKAGSVVDTNPDEDQHMEDAEEEGEDESDDDDEVAEKDDDADTNMTSKRGGKVGQRGRSRGRGRRKG